MARRLALTLVVLLAFPASALAAANVDINASSPIYSPQKVTISPHKVGAGPVVITVSNQSGAPRTLTLEGNGIQESVGPIASLSTDKLQKTLKPGHYTVKAGSEAATSTTIKPATLVIGKERASASDKVLLP